MRQVLVKTSIKTARGNDAFKCQIGSSDLQSVPKVRTVRSVRALMRRGCFHESFESRSGHHLKNRHHCVALVEMCEEVHPVK